MIESMKDEWHLINLLKHIFWNEPTSDLLTRLQEGTPVAEESELDRGLNALIAAVGANSDRLDAFREELAVEFTGLFIGPRQPPAVPFASFYLSETATLMTDVTVDVRKRYLAAEMAVKELYSLPDDHVAVELEFLGFLTDKCTESFAAGDRETASRLFEQRESFCREHFSRWVPQFAQKVIDAACGDFYRGAGIVLRELARG